MRSKKPFWFKRCEIRTFLKTDTYSRTPIISTPFISQTPVISPITGNRCGKMNFYIARFLRMDLKLKATEIRNPPLLDTFNLGTLAYNWYVRTLR